MTSLLDHIWQRIDAVTVWGGGGDIYDLTGVIGIHSIHLCGIRFGGYFSWIYILPAHIFREQLYNAMRGVLQRVMGAHSTIMVNTQNV